MPRPAEGCNGGPAVAGVCKVSPDAPGQVVQIKVAISAELAVSRAATSITTIPFSPPGSMGARVTGGSVFTRRHGVSIQVTPTNRSTR